MSTKTQVGARIEGARQGGSLSAISVLILGAIAADFLYCRRMVAGLVNPDAMDFAQIARNMMQGHGFATQILHPIALSRSSDVLHQPDMLHGVLYPFLLALGFGALGPTDAVVIAISGLFYVLTVPLVYLLGSRLFTARVGSIAALIFMTNSSILEYAASGIHITLAIFLATCLFYTLHAMSVRSSTDAGKEDAPSLPRPNYVLGGIFAALLYLTDPIFLFSVPVLLMTVPGMYPRRPYAALGWFAAPLFALIIPYMVRFGHLAGNPFFGLHGMELSMGTGAHPGMVGFRLTAEQLASEQGTTLSHLRKIGLAIVETITVLPRMPGSWILLFVAPSLVYQYSNPNATRLRNLLLGCLVAMIFGGVFFIPYAVRLMIVFPSLLIFAVDFLLYTLETAKLKPERVWAIASVLALVLLAPLARDLVQTRDPATTDEAATARALAKQMPKEDVSFSDQPWIAAWYGERASIWIPVEDQTIADFRHAFPRTRWLFLTKQTSSLSPEWEEMYRALLGWGQAYRRAQKGGVAVPPTAHIAGNQQPLLKALDGFEIVPPLDDSPATVVVATASDTGVKRDKP